MNKVVKNFLSTSVANIIGQLIGFVSITYYTAVLGRYNYGMITYAQQFVLYLTTIVLFGIQTFGTKLVVKKDKEYEELARDLFSFRLVIASICFIICVILSFFVSDKKEFPLVLIIWGLILFPTAFNFDWFFSGIQDMKHNAVYNICKTVIPALIIFVFVKEKSDIYIVPVAMVIGVVIGALYYVLILKRYKIHLKLSINKEKFKMYFIMGLPFLLSGLLSMVNGNIDKVILGADSTRYGELGTYQAAYNFINFIVTFIGIIFLPLFPYLVKSYTIGKEEVEKVLKVVAQVVLMITIPISCGGFLLADKIISFFYNGKFIGAVLPMRILMAYIFIFSTREIYAYSLNAFGLEKKYLKIVGISAFLNFLLNLVFIPKFGYIAAAIITAQTEVINFVLMRHNIRKIGKFNDFKVILITFIPSIVMSLFIIFIRMYISNLFIIIILSIMVYAVSLLLFRTVNIKELKNTLQ